MHLIGRLMRNHNLRGSLKRPLEKTGVNPELFNHIYVTIKYNKNIYLHFYVKLMCLLQRFYTNKY